MSDGLGIGDNAFDLSTAQGRAEAAVADAQRRRPDQVGVGRWPGIRTVLRILLAAAVAIVLGGWLLTALNAQR